MKTSRLEAFSDGVIAIIITIMVLELKAPHGAELAALRPLLPEILIYVLSFVYLAIYWNNHHHLLHASESVSGGILWANLHLLFWLSLIPFVTSWLGENPDAAWPTAMYGIVLLMAAIAYYGLQSLLIRHEGADSTLAAALRRDLKGKISPVLYASAIGLSFVAVWIADLIYLAVALMWFLPEPRIETALEEDEAEEARG
jgi:uncharacterized membrane protein